MAIFNSYVSLPEGMLFVSVKLQDYVGHSGMGQNL